MSLNRISSFSEIAVPVTTFDQSFFSEQLLPFIVIKLHNNRLKIFDCSLKEIFLDAHISTVNVLHVQKIQNDSTRPIEYYRDDETFASGATFRLAFILFGERNRSSETHLSHSKKKWDLLTCRLQFLLNNVRCISSSFLEKSFSSTYVFLIFHKKTVVSSVIDPKF